MSDDAHFGDIRSLTSQMRFREAHRIAFRLTEDGARERATAYVEDARARARARFDEDAHGLNFTHARDDESIELLHAFYPEEVADGVFDDVFEHPLRQAGLMVLLEHDGAGRPHPILLHAMLRHAYGIPGVADFFGAEPDFPLMGSFLRHDADIILPRLEHVLVHGFLLEEAQLDARPDLAERIARALPGWLGPEFSLWSNCYGGGAYINLSANPEAVIDEAIVGVGANRTALIWLMGYD